MRWFRTHVVSEMHPFALGWRPLGIRIGEFRLGWRRSPEEKARILARLEEFMAEGLELQRLYCEPDSHGVSEAGVPNIYGATNRNPYGVSEVFGPRNVDEDAYENYGEGT